MTSLSNDTVTCNEETTITSTYEEDMTKYTKIDNLDEDNGDIQYILVSFVSPEKVMNCNMRGLKVRHYRNRPAIFTDYAAAQKAAQELNERDKYFDIFVMPTGRWCAWDPSPDDRTKVESEKWANKEQQEVMENLEKMNTQKQQKDLAELNALVGKKKDMIQNSEVEHKNRIAESIKQGIKEKNEVKPGVTLEQPKLTEESLSQPTQSTYKKSHDSNSIKEKLRKKLEEKRQRETSSSSGVTQQKDSSVTELNKNLNQQVLEQSQLEQNINKAKAILEKIQNNKS